MSSHLKSYSSLAFAQVIVGANTVIAKILLPHVPVFVLLFMRFFVASIILSVLCFFKSQSPLIDNEGKKFAIKDWMVFLMQALCGGFLFNTFFITGLHYTDASTAGVIASTIPAMIAFLSFLFLGEHLGVKRIFSIVLAVVGLVVLTLGKTSGQHQNSLFGDFLIFVAIIPESFFTILAKRFKRNVSPFKLSLIVNVFNTILFFPLTITGLHSINPDFFQVGYLTLLLLYASGAALFFIFWYIGLEQLDAGIAAVFTALMPVSTTVLAYIFLNETITTSDLGGITLVIISIILGSFSLKKLKFRGFLLND